MSDLQGLFSQFSRLLHEPQPVEPEGGPPLAQTLLRTYPEDPAFWLRYAQICLGEEEFREASLALREMEERMTALTAIHPSSPLLALAFEVFRGWHLKCSAEMWKVVVRGNPAERQNLLRTLRELAEFPFQDLGKGLAELLSDPGQGPDLGVGLDPHWALKLERLVRVQPPGSASEKIGTLHDLAFALMGSGQYAEAARVLKTVSLPPFVEGIEEIRHRQTWYSLLLDWLQAFLLDPLRHVTPFPASGHRYVVPIVVWGEPYLDSLEQFTLPSLLAKGNLPYLREVGDIRLILFTTEAGARRLERMPVFQAIRRVVTADVLTFPAVLTEGSEVYKLMSAMHLASMEIAKATQSHFLFVAPDLVFADNFLQVVDQRMRRGAEVVFVPGLILHQEPFGAALPPPREEGGCVLSLPPSDLLELGLRYVHPYVRKAYTYTPNGRRSTLAVFLWPLPGGGYAVHGYHHTPFLISAPVVNRFDGSMFENIDGDFLPKVLRSQEEVESCHLVTDPSETTYFELSRTLRFGVTSGADLGKLDLGPFDIGRLSRSGALLGRVAQWLLPQKSCFDPTGAAAQDPALLDSSQVVAEILQGIPQVESEAAHLPVTEGAPSPIPLNSSHA